MLSGFEFTIEYKPGKVNLSAIVESRGPEDFSTNENQEASITHIVNELPVSPGPQPTSKRILLLREIGVKKAIKRNCVSKSTVEVASSR